MQLVALRDWYPRFDGWTGTLVPTEDRVGWVIHHTVGGTGQDPEAYARGVADYHYGKWGVPGGYNYLIGEDGLIRVMCGLAFRGVHSGTHDWNYKSLGLAFQGDFREAPPPDLMLEAASELIADTPIPADQWGHRDVRPKPTSCPGKYVYDRLPLEVDMPAPKDWDSEDLAVIKQLLEAHDNTFEYTNSAGQNRRVSGLAVNSTWHVDIAGKRAMDLLATLKNLPTADVEAIAKAVNDERDRRARERLS